METAVTRLEEGERGIYADLQWLYRFIEKRDATLRAVKRRLQASIGKLDWSIKVRDELPVGKQKVADRQEKFLRETYERIGNLQSAIDHLTLAEFRGFSHVEKHWEKDGNTWELVGLEPVPQWHWVRDGIYGSWEFVEDATSGKNRGEPVDLNNFLTREIDDPINEIALICFIRKSLSQKDWDGFIEVFGIPYVFIEMPQFADKKEQDEFLLVAQMMIGDSRGVLPPGSKIHSPTGVTRGIEPFSKHLGYQDQQIVLSATSGLLTVLTQSGSGTLAGNAHEETFDQIALALGKKDSECFQRHIDHPLLDERFPGEEHYAYFELEAKQEEDVAQVIEDAVKLSQAGYRIPAEEIAERTGYEVAEAEQKEFPGNGDTPVGPDPTVVSNRGTGEEPSADAPGPRSSVFDVAARNQLGQALAKDLSAAVTVAERFAEGDLSDESVDRLESELAAALIKALKDSQAGAEMSGILASAIANGAEGVKRTELRSDGGASRRGNNGAENR